MRGLEVIGPTRQEELGRGSQAQRPHASFGLGDDTGQALHRLAIRKPTLGIEVPPEDESIEETAFLGSRSSVVTGMADHDAIVDAARAPRIWQERETESVKCRDGEPWPTGRLSGT